MRAETQLDSVVFQLTPTRTRYDLVIIANGKKEKIASGLLDPFLAHLKTAEDQIAKGGYSIRLEADPRTDTTWFTKDTVERFVRYVSTPEVLDRVNTLESEVLQINEAIAIQMEDHQNRWTASIKGGKYAYNGDKEKAMLLSKHGKFRRLSTGSTMYEANSRHQLLRVLESRKNVLRKEQGMAFARAVAAGFDINHMTNLILFAKTFGASRLLEACMKFVALWKATHKNGQWLEAVGSDNITSSKKQFTETWIASCDNLTAESIEKDNHAVASDSLSHKLNSDYTEDPQALLGSPYYFNQLQNPMFHQWPRHVPPSPQPYLIQNMSYYHNYSYPLRDDQGSSIKNGLKRQSMDYKFSNMESNKMSQTEIDQDMAEFGKKTFKKAKSQSTSDVDSEKEVQVLHSDIVNVNGELNNDTENWQTFQKLLLRIQSENTNAIQNSNEENQEIRRLNKTQTDSILESECQKTPLHNIHDDSYVVPNRSNLQEKRVAMDLNSDFTAEAKKKNENCRYEPNVLSIMPNRDIEKGSTSFDPAKEYETQISFQKCIKKEIGNQENVSKRKEVRRKVDSMAMKGKSSKLNPQLDAKARAEKLRAFKADIHKVKKEKEEEERRRLEALKTERQKRIAARSNSSNIKSLVSAPQIKAQKPTRSAPDSFNATKFSDAKPTPFSPLKTANSSPNSFKSSKFSDRQPSPSSPLLKLLKSSKIFGQLALSPQKNQMQKPTRLFPSSSPVKNFPSNSKSAPLCNTLETTTQKPIRIHSSPSRSTKILSLDSRKVTNVDKMNTNINLVRKNTSQIQNSSTSEDSKMHQRRESYEKIKRMRGMKETVNVSDRNMKTRKEDKTINSYEEDHVVEKTVVILENKAMIDVGVGSCEDCKPDKQLHSLQAVKQANDTHEKANQFSFPAGIEEQTTTNTEHKEAHEKPHSRGSPKGFKDLLKFRRKSQSSSAIKLPTASTNAPTLRDLLSKDNHSGATPPKVSHRSFSSFSPFQNKSSEKRAAA